MNNLSFLRGLYRLFKKPRPRPRELVYLPYADGDRLIRADLGWRIAPEEDHNRVIGMVYLERDAQP